MSPAAKNLIVVLGIITLVFGVYYFFNQDAALVLRSSESEEQLAELVQTAETFSQRQQVLDQITLDTGLFEYESFNSLRDFSPEPEEFQPGRPDPFLPTTFVTTQSDDSVEQ